ncbi:ATP-binding protein [Luteibacter yeojuensis]|uniref:histidine kinase n=1 Tax=Luteibacter yeojuensis TaxID=345309 RepID=A0A0F3KZ79_9GAMM|nr:ATP-binding protein [Luteibacter yeojuensis]KJV36257.1 hypothetical protein VI08_05220 [Luteibacter yeojuensis]
MIERATDTIGRWLAVNILIAVLAAAAANAAFMALAGVWARPNLTAVGVIDQAAGVARVLDGAPDSLRAHLAAAASGPNFTVEWFASDAALPMPTLGATFHNGQDKVRTLLGRPDARVLAFEPGDPGLDGQPITFYALAIRMSDGSWTRFVATERSWGLSAHARLLLTSAFFIVSSLAVAAVAGRRLARPMQRFAAQAELFGRDVHAPAMTAEGPREFRVAASSFNTMQERIQRYVEGRTEILAAISHDLRAPLTRMRLRGEFIEDAEQQRKLFRDVDEMQAMVAEALAFFRDSSEAEGSTRFMLSELVHTVVDDFRDQGYAIADDIPDGVAYFGRPVALSRALANLVGNAVRYGDAVRVYVDVRDERLEVRVDDNGPGIPAEYREAVFRPFFRLERSRNRATGGVGLGLAAARSAARAHGGDVTLGDSPDGGLRAVLVLPLG